MNCHTKVVCLTGSAWVFTRQFQSFDHIWGVALEEDIFLNV